MEKNQEECVSDSLYNSFRKLVIDRFNGGEMGREDFRIMVKKRVEDPNASTSQYLLEIAKTDPEFPKELRRIINEVLHPSNEAASRWIERGVPESERIQRLLREGSPLKSRTKNKMPSK